MSTYANVAIISNVISESTDLYKKAKTLTTSAAQKLHQLHLMEQQFNFRNNDEKSIVLAHGRQEVLSSSKRKLQGKMEMLYLSIMKRQEGIQKESSTFVIVT